MGEMTEAAYRKMLAEPRAATCDTCRHSLDSRCRRYPLADDGLRVVFPALPQDRLGCGEHSFAQERR